MERAVVMVTMMFDVLSIVAADDMHIVAVDDVAYGAVMMRNYHWHCRLRFHHRYH